MIGAAARVCLIAALACLLPAGCADSRHEPESGARPARSVLDASGVRVRVPAEPRRIASLCSSATDTLIRLGAASRLLGIDEYSRSLPGATGLTVIGKGSAVSREQILGRAFDLAFVWWYQQEIAQTFVDLGVPVVRIGSARADEVPAMIRLVGEAAGQGPAAERLAERTARALADLNRAEPARHPVRVYAELYGPFKTSGSGTYLDDLIRLAGGTNIAGGARGSVLLSAEHLIEADPDAVLFVQGFATDSSLAGRAGLGGLSAVKQGRIFPFDRTTLVAGAGLPEAVAQLRACLAQVQLQEH